MLTASACTTGGEDPARALGDERDSFAHVGGAADSPIKETCGEEQCQNGLDDDCDGGVDEDCFCLAGSTQRCYDGPPDRAGVGICGFGTQICSGATADEFGRWGPCIGSGQPAEVQCGAGLDFHCNGRIDEGCPCEVGTTRTCYTGPPDKIGRASCRERV